MKKLLKHLSDHKKRYILILVLLLIFSGFIYRRNISQNTQPQLTSAQVEDLKQEVNASGIITGKDSANLRFNSGGKLAYVNVSVNDSVTEGQVIAGLDTQQLSINLNEAQINLRNAQATVEKVLDDIHLYQYGNGGFSNVNSANETEAQKQARTTAETARDNAVDALNSAQRAFQDAVITTPISGIVTQVIPLSGENVSPSDTIASIVNFNQIVFAADVDESDISKVNLGQKTQVTLNAYADKVFTGTVIEIEPTTHTTSNGATVVTTKILMDDQTIKPIVGLNGQANIIQTKKDNVLAISQDALAPDSTVIVKTAKGYEKRTVTTGFASDTDIEITSGLKSGDQLVMNPTQFKSLVK